MPMTRLLLVLALICCLSPSCAPGDTPVDAAGTTAFVGARIIDGTGGDPMEDGVLLVRDGRIEAVGPSASVSIPEGAQQVDLAGRTIIPGMINAHGHAAADADQMLPLYARYGVTTVVSLGGENASHVAMRDAQSTSDLNRARIYVAGEVLNSQTPEAAAEDVAALANAMDVDWVKIRVNQGSIPEEAYAAIIENAHNRGLRLAAHMYDLEDAKGLLRQGADFLAHSVRDQEVDQEFVEMLRESGVCLSPTLTREVSTFVYESTPNFFSDPFFLGGADMAIVEQFSQGGELPNQQGKDDLAMAQRNLAILSDAGIPIAMGTDSGASPQRFPGYFEHMELELMAEAGMTPIEILVSATGGAADCMGLSDDLGTLTAGKWADFAVLAANPLDDITNTKSLETVWIAGNPVPGM